MEGWICPKCGNVYSPFQNYCIKCCDLQPIITSESVPCVFQYWTETCEKGY